MKFRGLKYLAVAGFVVAASGNAYAQGAGGGMNFGSGDVQAAPAVISPVAGVLAEAKKLYAAKKYYKAAAKYYEVLQNQSDAAIIDRNDAQYGMARTLFHLELYQSSLSYYRIISETVGETHPHFTDAIDGLVELTDVIPEDSRLVRLFNAYTNLYPKVVPARYRSRFAYLVGRSKDPSEAETAIKMLNDVKPNSPDYAKAQYVSGVMNVSIYDAKNAVRNFKNSLRSLTAKQKKKPLDDDEKRLIELGYIALARVYYSTGQYKTSIKYYSRIDRNSENWPVVLFESSWAYFQLDNYNKALGNLQSLNSPFFSDRYFPEGSIVSAVLYFYNCRYDRVRAILDDFDYEYSSLQKLVEGLITNYESDLVNAFNLLMDARAGKLEKVKANNSSERELTKLEKDELKRVVSAALTDKTLRNKLQILADIYKELDKLKKTPKNFRNSAVGKQLIKLNTDDITTTKIEIGELVIERLRSVNRELLDLIESEGRILFEVDRAERGEIESELASAQTSATKIKTYKVKPTDEQLAWTFDGEYWRDELGYYVVTTASQCKR